MGLEQLEWIMQNYNILAHYCTRQSTEVPSHGFRCKMSTILSPNGTSGRYFLTFLVCTTFWVVLFIENIDTTLDSLLSAGRFEHPPTCKQGPAGEMNWNLRICTASSKYSGTPVKKSCWCIITKLLTCDYMQNGILPWVTKHYLCIDTETLELIHWCRQCKMCSQNHATRHIMEQISAVHINFTSTVDIVMFILTSVPVSLIRACNLRPCCLFHTTHKPLEYTTSTLWVF